MISYKDVNRQLLLEKETWTFYLLGFSCIRNNFHILCKRKKKPHDVTCPQNVNSSRVSSDQADNDVIAAQMDDNNNLNFIPSIEEDSFRRSVGSGSHAMRRKAQRLVGNLAVMDAIRVLISFQICYALAFYCARFQLVQFQNQAAELQESATFLFVVESSYESVHTLFMISGFLQAFSFMSKWYHK